MANCRAMVRASGIVLWVSSRSSKIMRTYTTFSPQIMGSQVVGMAPEADLDAEKCSQPFNEQIQETRQHLVPSTMTRNLIWTIGVPPCSPF